MYISNYLILNMWHPDEVGMFVNGYCGTCDWDRYYRNCIYLYI